MRSRYPTCDTRSHILSELVVEVRLLEMQFQVSVQWPVPALDVRCWRRRGAKLRGKPEDLRSTRGLQARERPDG